MAAAPPHVRAAPLARAFCARASATAAAAVPPKPQSQANSRRALVGLSETDLRQLALDLGQVLLHQTTTY